MILSGLIKASIVLIGVANAGVVLADDDKVEDSREMAALAAAKITLAEAIAAAQALVPGSIVLTAAVDTENGVPTYVVDLEKNGMQRVFVDIGSGEAKMASAEGESENGDDENEDENEDRDEEEEDRKDED